ncbi:MAG: CHAT domain-containing protein, partial [Gammaproteobacteria bacterium]|nr:CHAT domain-containing protein [Gammaproteobacteria bacterium]
MKRLATIFCVFYLLTMTSPIQAVPLDQGNVATLTLTNDSDETICFVQIASAGAKNGGNNWLDKEDVIQPDQKRAFDFEAGAYDVRLRGCDDTLLLEKDKLAITAHYALSFSQADLCEALYQEGESLRQQAEYAAALEQFQQALTCYQEVGNRAGEGTSLNNIGLTYDTLGEYLRALGYYRQGLAIFKEINHHTGEGIALNNIGAVYLELDRYDQALDYYQQSLAIHQEIDDRAEEARTLNNIGIVYRRLDEYEQALGYYQQSLAILEEIDDQAKEATTLTNIGESYHRLGEYEQTLDYYEQSLAIFKEIDDRFSEARVLNNIGGVYQSLGEYQQAIGYFRQSLTIFREIGDLVREKIALSNIGDIYKYWGEYEQASSYYEQSLAIRQEMGNDRIGEGILFDKIGEIYQRIGEFEKALEYHRRGLTIFEEIDSQADRAVALHNIGEVYHSLGDYEQALDHYERSLAIHQHLGDRHGEGVSLNNIGKVYQRIGEFEKALDHFQKSLVIAQEINDSAEEAASLNGIGGLYRSLRKYEQALIYFQRSLAIFQKIGNRAWEGATLNDIGLVYSQLNEYEQALDYFQQSLAIRQKISDRPGEGVSLINIGSVYNELNEYEQALDYYQQAIETVESVRSRAGSEQGRASYIERYSFLYRQMVDLLHQEGQEEKAFLTVERGRARAFLDSLATGQVRLQDDDAAALLAREQAAYDRRQTFLLELVEARAATPPDPNQIARLEAQLAETETAYEEVQAAIAARGVELVTLVPGRSADIVLDVEQVQPLLDDQTTLVAYYLLKDNILAFVLTSTSFETVVLEADLAELVQQITAFRDFANLTAAYPATVVALYEMLIAPLKDHLNTPHLAIIPHQQLHYLPFAALTDGKRYLIDDYTLTTLPSASTLPFIQNNITPSFFSPHPSALIVGNPTTADYDTVASLTTTRDSLASLPFAEKEAKAIAELFGVEPLIGNAATESAVREHVGEANILHLAAHGQFNPIA